MKNTYKVGDWVIGWHAEFESYNKIAWQIYNITPSKCAYGVSINPRILSHGTEIYAIRLATSIEIIKAGGKPNKIELNYEIY